MEAALWLELGAPFWIGQVVAIGLITIGLFGFFVRKNLLVLLMCLELMLNGVNLSFVSFARVLQDVHGELMQLFVMTIAAAESAVGLAFLIALFRSKRDITTDALERSSL